MRSPQRAGEKVRVLLLADAVLCAVAAKTPNGFHKLERNARCDPPPRRRGRALRDLHGREGIHEEPLVDRARRSTLEELIDWTLWADKVITF